MSGKLRTADDYPDTVSLLKHRIGDLQAELTRVSAERDGYKQTAEEYMSGQRFTKLQGQLNEVLDALRPNSWRACYCEELRRCNKNPNLPCGTCRARAILAQHGRRDDD